MRGPRKNKFIPIYFCAMHLENIMLPLAPLVLLVLLVVLVSSVGSNLKAEFNYSIISTIESASAGALWCMGVCAIHNEV